MLVEEQTTVAPLVKYDINEAALALMKARCADLSADTSKGYEEVRLALAELRNTRVAIEKRRVELKADALAFGRLVDSEAKRYTTMLIEIEEPLSQKKHDVDYEKARLKAEVEAKKQAELEAKIRAEREAEEARLLAVREAEEARLATERAQLDAERAALAEERRQAEVKAAEAHAVLVAAERVNAAKIEAERIKLADERRAEEERQRATRKVEEDRQRMEREAIEQERRKVVAEREKAERIEFERQAKIKAETEAVAKAERDRLAAAEQAAKLAALAPDIEKVRAFAAAIRALQAPTVKSKQVAACLVAARQGLEQVAWNLDVEAGRV